MSSKQIEVNIAGQAYKFAVSPTTKPHCSKPPPWSTRR